jgi:hypothetical protein
MDTVRRTWIPILSISVLLLCVAVGIAFALLVPTIHRVTTQAMQGEQAKLRQCQTLPAAVAVYTDAEHRGVITAAQLAVFEHTEPTC